jgi:hypothetical protein
MYAESKLINSVAAWRVITTELLIWSENGSRECGEGKGGKREARVCIVKREKCWRTMGVGGSDGIRTTAMLSCIYNWLKCPSPISLCACLLSALILNSLLFFQYTAARPIITPTTTSTITIPAIAPLLKPPLLPVSAVCVSPPVVPPVVEPAAAAVAPVLSSEGDGALVLRSGTGPEPEAVEEEEASTMGADVDEAAGAISAVLLLSATSAPGPVEDDAMTADDELIAEELCAGVPALDDDDDELWAGNVPAVEDDDAEVAVNEAAAEEETAAEEEIAAEDDMIDPVDETPTAAPVEALAGFGTIMAEEHAYST